MKKIISSAAIALGLAVSANAGTASKQVVVAAPTIYGAGFYLGLQGGINTLQTEGPGDKSEIGGVGGIKAGYVFGTGVVRPTVEADLFYNGFRQSAPGVKNDIDSGAFLANFLFRFDAGQFQPYVGAGVGGYYGEASNGNGPVGGAGLGNNGPAVQTAGPGAAATVGGPSNSTSGLAWQAVAGADFYFTPTISVFSEYKFLNYVDTDLIARDLQQHLVVLGVRMHF